MGTPHHLELHLAAFFGLKEIIKLLLRSGQNPDMRDRDGRTPLSWAAARGHKLVVELLLSRSDVDLDRGACRADTFFEDRGRRPLSLAAESSHASVVELLLAHAAVHLDSEADGTKCRNCDRTPPSSATKRGHKDIVESLLKRPEIDPESATRT